MAAVKVSSAGGAQTLTTPRFVVAAGPLLRSVGRLVGVDLPVFCERHAKFAFNDVLGALPREAPLTIWTDPVRLPWSDDERAELADSEHRRLLDEFPPGVHGRPEGAGESRSVLLIWTYDVEPVPPTFPVQFDPAYAEIAIRGMARMVPAMAGYLSRLPRAFVDGGYYTKTRENRFLAGPLPLEGAFVIGALSGYGLMSSNTAADLLAAPYHRRPTATLRPRLHALPLRRPHLRRHPRHLDRLRPTVRSSRSPPSVAPPSRVGVGAGSPGASFPMARRRSRARSGRDSARCRRIGCPRPSPLVSLEHGPGVS